MTETRDSTEIRTWKLIASTLHDDVENQCRRGYNGFCEIFFVWEIYFRPIYLNYSKTRSKESAYNAMIVYKAFWKKWCREREPNDVSAADRADSRDTETHLAVEDKLMMDLTKALETETETDGQRLAHAGTAFCSNARTHLKKEKW